MNPELHPAAVAAILKQHEHRPSWIKHDTPQVIDDLIREEGGTELQEAIELCMIGAPPEYLISELADTLYLAVRRNAAFPEEPVPDDVAQIVQNAVDLCSDLGVDPSLAVMMKVLRNDLKYPHSISNNGLSYAEGAQLSKTLYLAMTNGQGDYSFYLAWETVADTYCHEIVTDA